MTTPTWSSPRGDVTLYCGDAADVLAALPDGSVDCCVTSPPYWGLRDYGTGTWEGGSAECDHKINDAPNGNKGQPVEHAGRNGSVCRKCGARRIDRQIGLEPTPVAYVAAMVKVFREVRRVLADDGTCWMNLGDSYANDGKWGGQTGGKHVDGLHGNGGPGRQKRQTELKPKDMCGIPWRVAFALQADGWYLRQDIIWHKPNPMPESVRDRCTKAHEYIFLLTKRERYHYDAAAIAEEAVTDAHSPGWAEQRPTDSGPMKRSKADGSSAIQWDEPDRSWGKNGTRNKRSVWTVTTESSGVNHFATYPTKLVEPCILAGCKHGGTVLDPFCGTATTGAVAIRKERRFIGIDLSAKYLDISRERLEGELAQRDAGLFGPAPIQTQGKMI